MTRLELTEPVMIGDKVHHKDNKIIFHDKLLTVHDAIIKHWQYFDLAQDQGHIRLGIKALCLLIRVKNEKSGTNKTGNLPILDSKKSEMMRLFNLLDNEVQIKN